MLGNCIWNYLHNLCSEQNISVVIVTHYIEEAAFGHVVGIMRNGTILEEGPPTTLTTKYGQSSLEKVFLYLCTTGTVPVEDEPSTLSSLTTQKTEPSPLEATKAEVPNSEQSFGRNLFLNLWILNVLVRKNLTRFFQFDISFLIFLIPAFQVLILCTLYNRDAIPVSR